MLKLIKWSTISWILLLILGMMFTFIPFIRNLTYVDALFTLILLVPSTCLLLDMFFSIYLSIRYSPPIRFYIPFKGLKKGLSYSISIFLLGTSVDYVINLFISRSILSTMISIATLLSILYMFRKILTRRSTIWLTIVSIALLSFLYILGLVREEEFTLIDGILSLLEGG
ncbi:MAG: hypothetical protein QW775_06180 [Ignisphaera sp.]|uniref:Uncharacterized protein n=1 Tax=Ignisphaera aggregans TaxID=334771 RepID=A0A7C4NQK4_9CREN